MVLLRPHDDPEVEAVGVTLAADLGEDHLVVVVAHGAAHLVVVHVGLWRDRRAVIKKQGRWQHALIMAS